MDAEKGEPLSKDSAGSTVSAFGARVARSEIGPLPDRIHAWRFEAEILAEQRTWEFFRAFDHVIVRYLLSGDARPLLDLIVKQRRDPGPKVGQFLAAIADSQTLLEGAFGSACGFQMTEVPRRLRNEVLPCEIRITENRGRGRPTVLSDDKFKRDVGKRLIKGFSALASSGHAPRPFWIDLAHALDFKGYERSMGTRFPFKATFRRTDGGTGRPRDPELEMRDHIFHAAVLEKRATGSKYEIAITDVLADLEAQRKAEGWTKKFKPKTIKDAHDRIARKSKRD